jgi:hypothetical protein
MSNLKSITFISLMLVAATLQSAPSCSSEPDRPTAPPAPNTGKNEAAPKDTGPEMIFEGPGALLARDFGPWSIAEPARYFGPENLYDLINGGAEIYVEYGLTKMVTADYRAEGNKTQTITVEVYDMGSPRGAFGRVARFLESHTDPTFAGNGLPTGLVERGILGDGDAVFWKDKYLVHLTLLEENPAADPNAIAAAGKRVLPVFAVAIAGGIEADPPLPTTFARFPLDDRVKRSEAWHPVDVLAIRGLGPGWSVRYSDGKASWTAFASESFADEQTAEAAWSSVKSSAAEGRRVAVKIAGGRVVGLVQDDEPKPPDAVVEKLAAALQTAFTQQ